MSSFFKTSSYDLPDSLRQCAIQRIKLLESILFNPFVAQSILNDPNIDRSLQMFAKQLIKLDNQRRYGTRAIVENLLSRPGNAIEFISDASLPEWFKALLNDFVIISSGRTSLYSSST